MRSDSQQLGPTAADGTRLAALKLSGTTLCVMLNLAREQAAAKRV